jgi:hypothetical protein
MWILNLVNCAIALVCLAVGIGYLFYCNPGRKLPELTDTAYKMPKGQWADFMAKLDRLEQAQAEEEEANAHYDITHIVPIASNIEAFLDEYSEADLDFKDNFPGWKA